MQALLVAFMAAHPVTAALLAGFWSAFVVDVFAFMAAKTPGDFLGQFDPTLAAWRWLHGTIGGLLGLFGVAAAGTAIATMVMR